MPPILIAYSDSEPVILLVSSTMNISLVKMCVFQASISVDSISSASVNYPVNWSGDSYEHNIRVTHNASNFYHSKIPVAGNDYNQAPFHF